MKPNPRKQACAAQQYRLSKTSFLASLYSRLDETKAVIVETGEVLILANYTQDEITTNINNKTWVYYETESPRKLFILNPNWTVDSFDPATRSVCVTITSNTGSRKLNFTLPKTVGRK